MIIPQIITGIILKLFPSICTAKDTYFLGGKRLTEKTVDAGIIPLPVLGRFGEKKAHRDR